MQLNHDCVRDILLACEKLPYNHYFSKSELLDTLQNHTEDDILYSILKLDEAKYLNINIYAADGLPIYDLYLSGITWEGHKFLDTIRDNEVWSQTKSILGKVSSASITFASNVASQVLTNIISKQMGLM